MNVKKLMKRIIPGLLAFMLITASVPVFVYADEAAPEEEAAGEENGEENAEGSGEEGELSEEEALAMAEAAQAELEKVVPSDIGTNIDGKYIALSFPASEVPEGFAVKTVDYQGQQVSLAYMTSKSATIGAEGLTVHLAYLTDKDGNKGEFYLCDTTENAKMSDMIMIEGNPGKYIIILDPGDNVVGPDGFSQHKLQWGNKTATAWSLPEELPEEEDASEESSKEPEKEASLFGVKAYAAELNLNAGEAARSGGAGDTESGVDNGEESGEEDAAPPEDSGEGKDDEGSGDKDKDDADDSAMVALDAIAHTNASGLIQAQPKEFCLLYAIDESANLGFYLYDIERGTYQRYVDIPKGESQTLVKYKKLSRTRLFIIIVLAIALVIAIFILVNTIINKKGDEYGEDEEDPEEEAMRQRAKAKERKSIGKRERAYLLDEETDDEDFEDDYEDEEEEDDYGEEEDEDEESVPASRTVRHRSITHPVQKAEDDVDWENMEITAGLNPKKTNAALNKKKKEQEFDFDEDFDFEFLDVKK